MQQQHRAAAAATFDEDGDLIVERPSRRAPAAERVVCRAVRTADVVLADLVVALCREKLSCGTIVELRSGSALASLVARKSATHHVFATDSCDADGGALCRLQRDIAASGVRVRRLNPLELPRLVRAGADDGADDEGLRGACEWSSDDLTLLRRAETFIAGTALLAGGGRSQHSSTSMLPLSPADARAEGEAKASVLLAACATWAKGGPHAASAEVTAREMLSGGLSGGSREADEEGMMALAAALTE
eukprot:2187773-Prymnesium_polylepis.1